MSIPPFEAPQIAELQELLTAYEILDFIAKGGMGAVYRARQVSLDREVAIKILPREFGEDVEFRAGFETEAKAMARLNHPNLIGVYDFGDVRGMPYIVMEHVNGKSLFHSACNTVVEPTQAVQIVKGICAGLAHAHANGVIHRDIKPANILLTPKAEPKIGDFGLALAGGQNDPDLVMGTPGYAAPELFHAPHAAGEHTDIYAVGVILHELLSGQSPDSADKVACPSTGDACLDTIWQKAVHPDPAQRYHDMAAMADALGAWKPGPAQLAPRQLMAAPAPQRRPQPVIPRSLSTRSKPSLVGKLFIIAGLLVAIAFAHQNLKRAQSERDAENLRLSSPNPVSPRSAEGKFPNADVDHLRGLKGSASSAEPAPGDGDMGAPSESIFGMTPSEENAESPDELAAVLERTKDSLGKAKPVFPPGTFMIAGRHFAPILRPVDRAEAEHLAQLAGGMIAVPATKEEADGIQEECRSLNAADGFWLGGVKSRFLWRWDSGESWTFARWTSGTDHDLEDSAMVLIPGSGWKNADPVLKASGVLIEWSDDINGKSLKQEDGPIAILNRFDPQAVRLVGRKVGILNEWLAGNVRDFTAALNHGQRKLPNDKDRQKWQPLVDALKNAVENHRVPDARGIERLGGIQLTPDMERICTRHFMKQQECSTKFTAEITALRDYYVKNLKTSADDCLTKGQNAMADRISAKAEAAADLDAWLASLMNDGSAVMELPVIGSTNRTESSGQAWQVAKARDLELGDWLKTVRFRSDNGIQLFIEGERMRLGGIKGFKHRIDEPSQTVHWENRGKHASITVNPDRKSGVWTNTGGVQHRVTVIQVK